MSKHHPKKSLNCKTKFLKILHCFYEIAGGVCIILTFLFAYLDYGPKISVEVNNELSLQNTMAFKYKIHNDGFFQIQNIKVISNIINIKDSGQNSFNNCTESKTIKIINGNDYEDIIFQSLFYSQKNIDSGLIEIVVIFESVFANKIPLINKTHTYHKVFKAIKDKDKNVYWITI